jgi:hypothetical protein
MFVYDALDASMNAIDRLRLVTTFIAWMKFVIVAARPVTSGGQLVDDVGHASHAYM